MRKIISVFSALAIAFGSLAFAPPVQAVAPFWDVTGPWVAGFQLDGVGPVYLHDMFLTQDGLGNVTGDGGYLAGSPPYSYHWNITSGSVSGDEINLTMDYDVGAVGTTMHMTGTIAPGGSTMLGDWDDNLSGGRVGTWETTSGAAVWLDADYDGVFGGADFCPGTASDVGSWTPGPLGTNRWELNNDFDWQQNKPKVGPTTSGGFKVADTYGCSGQQILDLVSALTGEDLGGHYKYGLSSSMLKDFIEDGKDGIIDGINSDAPVETVVVPADDADGVSSAASLALGKNYKLKASGTADACVSGCGYSIIFDPEYSTSNSGTTWEDGVAAPYDGFGPDLLDLKVNGGFVNWDDDATYNTDHTYWSSVAGTGAPVSLQVNDVFYPNNSGSLTVDIFVELY